MFFYFSKFVWFFFEPSNLAGFLLVIAALLLWRGRVRAAKLIVTGLALAFLAILFLPIGHTLLLPLESRFPRVTQLPSRVDGIVLLGGAQRPMLTYAHGQPSLNGAAETLIQFLVLARRYPEAKLVFTGGSGNPLDQDVSEADTVALFLREQNFDDRRVIYERYSRNTYENALFAHKLVNARPEETWLVVQSAAAIPRAVGAFRKVGWNVVAFPCDYNVTPEIGWQPGLSAFEAMSGLRYAIHEWVGLAVYYATGKSSQLFPAP